MTTDSRPADAAYPDALRAAEATLLGRPPRIGVGLSGGGIRSATFALGVFQAWAKRGFLGSIDVLSTVSGGGYFGGFYGRLFSRDYIKNVDDVAFVLGSDEQRTHPDEETAPDLPAPHETEERRRRLAKPRANVIKWLRENGRYLAPRGAGDVLIAGSVLLRNWLSIHAVLGALLLSAFLFMQLPRVIDVQRAIPAPAAAVARVVLDRLPFADSILWWSPWALLSLVALAFVVPVSWAYWLKPRSRVVWLALVAAILAGVLLLRPASSPALHQLGWVAAAVAGLALLSLAVWVVANTFVSRLQASPETPDPEERRKRQLFIDFGRRNQLSSYLKTVLIVAATLALVAFVDTLGQTMYAMTSRGEMPRWLAAVGAVITGAAALARQVAVLFGQKAERKRPGMPLSILAMIVAAALVLALSVSYSSLAHAIVWQFGPANAPAHLLNTVAGQGDRLTFGPFALWLAALTLFAWALGRSMSFVNSSSHQPLYAARLTRAYLGASNDQRWTGKPKPVIFPVEGDDATMSEYWPADAATRKGAPLHIVNVTINETVGAQSQTQHQDRKGLTLAVGPAGLSAGIKHHVLFGELAGPDTSAPRIAIDANDVETADNSNSFRVFEYRGDDPQPAGVAPKQAAPKSFAGDTLSVGQWIGISGAAFTTGLGSRTSLGLSLLTGLMNVRLGHWWNSNINLERREHAAAEGRLLTRVLGRLFERLFLAQKFLLSECIARFPGVARKHWYLSDGGHFENMGGYELIRRRLDLMVIVDGEEDAAYTFGGLGNLVRKARIDFGAEITFLPRHSTSVAADSSLEALGLPLEIFGSLDDLRLQGDPPDENDPQIRFSGAHAALARVEYEDEVGLGKDRPKRWLLYLKSTLTGDEATDVIEYARGNAPFPHQTTGDQFFDESQWESYRRLGVHVANSVFCMIEGRGDEKKWSLRQFGVRIWTGIGKH